MSSLVFRVYFQDIRLIYSHCIFYDVLNNIVYILQHELPAWITADQLIKSGVATYPIMGIQLATNFSGSGALVAAVTVGYPAAKAGIQKGDVITEIDGKEIANSDEAIVIVRSHDVGDALKIKFTRNGSTKEVSITLVAAKN